MQLLIWGAGAIGGTLGAYLAKAGHDVTFVDRVGEHVAAINADGLSITGPIAEFNVKTPAYTPDTISGEWETILLCVKAQDTAAATQALAPFLRDEGYVVSVQNGLNELVISEIVGKAHTVGSFVNFGADYMEPGVIMYGGRGAVVLGELDGSLTTRLDELHKTFSDFEPNAIKTQNIWGFLWGKMAYGAQLFVTALTNESIAAALADTAYRDIYIAIAQEVLAVATAQGVTPEAFNGFDPHAFMPDTDPAVSLRSLDDMAVHNSKSAKTHSGIWRDLAVRKRKTEADAQLGPIVSFGEKSGVPTPLTAKTIAMIHEIEDGTRPLQIANLDQLKALLA